MIILNKFFGIVYRLEIKGKGFWRLEVMISYFGWEMEVLVGGISSVSCSVFYGLEVFVFVKLVV